MRVRGLAGSWATEPDVLTLGKAIAAGVPLATYGMTDELATLIAQPDESHLVSGAVVAEVATGGTLYANALSMAAGRAALMDVLTVEAFEHSAALGARMGAGLRDAIASVGLRWSVVQEGVSAARYFAPTSPRNGAESGAWTTTPSCAR